MSGVEEAASVVGQVQPVVVASLSAPAVAEAGGDVVQRLLGGHLPRESGLGDGRHEMSQSVREMHYGRLGSPSLTILVEGLASHPSSCSAPACVERVPPDSFATNQFFQIQVVSRSHLQPRELGFRQEKMWDQQGPEPL